MVRSIRLDAKSVGRQSPAFVDHIPRGSFPAVWVFIPRIEPWISRVLKVAIRLVNVMLLFGVPDRRRGPLRLCGIVLWGIRQQHTSAPTGFITRFGSGSLKTAEMVS